MQAQRGHVEVPRGRVRLDVFQFNFNHSFAPTCDFEVLVDFEVLFEILLAA
jgi:hypothetical protein